MFVSDWLDGDFYKGIIFGFVGILLSSLVLLGTRGVYYLQYQFWLLHQYRVTLILKQLSKVMHKTVKINAWLYNIFDSCFGPIIFQSFIDNILFSRGFEIIRTCTFISIPFENALLWNNSVNPRISEGNLGKIFTSLTFP